ncbi:hypothetical protein U1Q18_028959 [Sarracenia purpurea var. burkii]
MKVRNKGKVYPSPSSSSSASSSSSMSAYSANRDALSVLKLLPAVILALVSVLSMEDRQVLAYMMTRSMKSSLNPSSIIEEKKKTNKKSIVHKPPVFDCECFDCYRSYWFRWDSSPNRELIHQAIEAFEEHLATEEQSKKSTRGKKREKMGRRGTDQKPINISETTPPAPAERDSSFPASDDRASSFAVSDDSFVVILPENESEGTAGDIGEEEVDETGNMSPEEARAAVGLRSSSANNHKGLARKVLPDVVGLLNSRLWSLWSPNV